MTGRVVVVGAGECGAAIASNLRVSGFDGSVTLIGDERIPPYERPPLSKQALTGDAPIVPVVVLDDERCRALGIERRSGTRVRTIDRASRKVETSDGEVIAYDRLILATGSTARALDVPGGEVALTLRTVDDAVALRAHLAPGVRVGVIGAGLIGLELAASARFRGCQVTVVEFADRVLSRAVPAALAAIIADRHIARGVDLRCGVAVEQIRGSGSGHRVLLSDGSSLDCDLLVAGVGALPNTDLAVASGLEVDNGVRVDAQLRTSDPAIFAAGDCCSFPHPLFDGRRIRLETWRNAHDQASVVAANVIGGNMDYEAVPWFWSDQYDLGLQVAGMGDAATAMVHRTDRHGGLIVFGLDADGRLVVAGAVGTGTSIAKDVRLAEMLIAGRAHPDHGDLANSAVTLKSLVIAARQAR